VTIRVVDHDPSWPQVFETIEDRHAFHEPDEPARHVYVTVDGCLSLRNHLGVRDVLRSDPQLRTEYGELKKRLAAQYTADEIDHYVEAKSVVIQKVLSKAGLLPDELAFVDDVNRPPSRDEAST
jgi:GrpB-like predicted nucleotidyltransferase (UPF0157 family)